MAIVLEANYSKKLGLPGYSSHQYSVTVRTELTDLSGVESESALLYQRLQSAVDTEIRNAGWLPSSDTESNGRNDQSHNGERERSAEPEPTWSCSDKQRELILKIVDENNLDRHGIEQTAQARFGKGVRSLNRLEASALIDELLQLTGRETRNNGRKHHSFRANGRASGRRGR